METLRKIQAWCDNRADGCHGCPMLLADCALGEPMDWALDEVREVIEQIVKDDE